MNKLWKIGYHAMINIGGVTSMIFFFRVVFCFGASLFPCTGIMD
jgi:hypothetical protein